MYALHIRCPTEDYDRIVSDLWERGTTGIVEHPQAGPVAALTAFFEERFDTRGWADLNPTWEIESDQDWVALSESQWSTVLVGSRFFLVPSWRDDPTPSSRIRLEMRPGQACGTGWGEATQLALEGMEKVVCPGATVLDLGTGSGILTVAGARLGARVFACDIDAAAATEAAARFRDEQVDAGLFVGSLRSLRDGSIDCLVANLNAEVLVELASEAARVTAPNGHAVLSGFGDRHLERVRPAFAGRGEVLQKGEWRALIW